MGKQNNTAATDTRLEKIEERLGQVEREVHGINTTLKVVAGGVAVLLIFAIGLALTAGKSIVRDIARDVYREEVAYHTQLQAGTLSKSNTLYGGSSQPTATRHFRWDLQKPVDPNKVIDARAKARKLPQGVKVDCDITDDGKACVFTLTGPADLIKSLDLPIVATAMIDVAN